MRSWKMGDLDLPLVLVHILTGCLLFLSLIFVLIYIVRRRRLCFIVLIVAFKAVIMVNKTINKYDDL